MKQAGCLLLALLLAGAAAGSRVAADENAPLPPLRPPELGGPDPVADWSDPAAPLEASPPKAERLAPAAASDPANPADPAPLPVPETAAAPEPEGLPGPDSPPDAASPPEHPPEAEPEGPVAAEHDAPPVDEALAEERPAFDAEAAERCEAELRALGAEFALAEPIEEAGCGAERPLALAALPGGIAVEGPEALLRCEAALAAATWSREVVAPSALLHLDTTVVALVVSTSYHCRGRAGGTTPSQHAFANALDVLGLRFADGSAVLIAPRPESAEPERAFQAAIRGGACAYFTTVIGPTTNAAHDDHLHLDVKRRSSGYRVCE